MGILERKKVEGPGRWIREQNFKMKFESIEEACTRAIEELNDIEAELMSVYCKKSKAEIQRIQNLDWKKANTKEESASIFTYDEFRGRMYGEIYERKKNNTLNWDDKNILDKEEKADRLVGYLIGMTEIAMQRVDVTNVEGDDERFAKREYRDNSIESIKRYLEKFTNIQNKVKTPKLPDKSNDNELPIWVHWLDGVSEKNLATFFDGYDKGKKVAKKLLPQDMKLYYIPGWDTLQMQLQPR